MAREEKNKKRNKDRGDMMNDDDNINKLHEVEVCEQTLVASLGSPV